LNAERTERTRLTSAVTVLSSDDPLRVFQRFATLDLLLPVRADTAARWTGTTRTPLQGQEVHPRSSQLAGDDPDTVPFAVTGHAFVAPTSQEAADIVSRPTPG